MIICHFINGRETDCGTWRLARKLCKKDSIPHKVLTLQGTNWRYLIQRHLNCDEDMLLRSHLKRRRYVFDYFIDEHSYENFCLDDRLTGQTHVFKNFDSFMFFLLDHNIRLKQIENYDAAGFAWADVKRAYKSYRKFYSRS